VFELAFCVPSASHSISDHRFVPRRGGKFDSIATNRVAAMKTPLPLNPGWSPRERSLSRSSTEDREGHGYQDASGATTKHEFAGVD
jgi:hypothetical protein